MKQTLTLLVVTIALAACGDDTFNYQFPEEEAPTPPVVEKPTPVTPTPVTPTPVVPPPAPTPPCKKDHKCEDDDDKKGPKS